MVMTEKFLSAERQERGGSNLRRYRCRRVAEGTEPWYLPIRIIRLGGHDKLRGLMVVGQFTPRPSITSEVM
jgi:hypothetical protein